MDDRAFFDLHDEPLTPFQLDFLAALRLHIEARLRPYCAELDDERLLVVLDVDAPDRALMNVGLELTGNRLRGDRISVHDRTFPTAPTPDGFVLVGTPAELAARGSELLHACDCQRVVRHEWLHQGQVYATCHLIEATGERLAQMFRKDLAPPGQERTLAAGGHVNPGGWVQTEGLGTPDRVIVVRGDR